MKPSSILYKSAKYIEEHGWVKNTFQDSDGRVCIRGAIGIVTSGKPHDVLEDGSDGLVTVRALGDFLIKTESIHTNKFAPITSFNDGIAKNKTHVVKKLREAARKLKEEGK